MEKKEIFIHIPKTGGTSINSAMMNSQWQTTPDFNYRHIIYATKKSNSGDIFTPEKRDFFSDYNIFTMLRNPVDRLLSEYHFLKMRPEFFNLLSKKPNNFLEYCQLPETQNYVIKFLLGYRIYDKYILTKEKFNTVLDTFNELPIYTGIFEEFSLSLNYFTEKTGIEWNKEIPKKRMTLNRPKMDSIPLNEFKEIIALNDFDNILYTAQKTILLNHRGQLPAKEFIFSGDRYNYVEVFVQRFFLIEIDLHYQDFVKRHSPFFKKLHKKISQESNNGQEYVKNWNTSFIKICTSTYPETELVKLLLTIQHTEDLEATLNICKAIDTVFLSGIDKRIYSKKLSF